MIDRPVVLRVFDGNGITVCELMIFPKWRVQFECAFKVGGEKR